MLSMLWIKLRATPGACQSVTFLRSARSSLVEHFGPEKNRWLVFKGGLIQEKPKDHPIELKIIFQTTMFGSHLNFLKGVVGWMHPLCRFWELRAKYLWWVWGEAIHSESPKIFVNTRVFLLPFGGTNTFWTPLLFVYIYIMTLKTETVFPRSGTQCEEWFYSNPRLVSWFGFSCHWKHHKRWSLPSVWAWSCARIHKVYSQGDRWCETGAIISHLFRDRIDGFDTHGVGLFAVLHQIRFCLCVNHQGDPVSWPVGVPLISHCHLVWDWNLWHKYKHQPTDGQP